MASAKEVHEAHPSADDEPTCDVSLFYLSLSHVVGQRGPLQVMVENSLHLLQRGESICFPDSNMIS